MQASVTTVFRSAIPAGSIPISSASPASAWRITATFSARAGRDIASPLGTSSVVDLSDINSISPPGLDALLGHEHIWRFQATRYPGSGLSETSDRDSILSWYLL